MPNDLQRFRDLYTECGIRFTCCQPERMPGQKTPKGALHVLVENDTETRYWFGARGNYMGRTVQKTPTKEKFIPKVERRMVLPAIPSEYFYTR